MKALAVVFWWSSLLSIAGSLVAFIVMEASRTGGISASLALSFKTRYQPEAFTARGRRAQSVCVLLVTVALLSMLVGGAIVIGGQV
jgi:hypothetical protein